MIQIKPPYKIPPTALPPGAKCAWPSLGFTGTATGTETGSALEWAWLEPWMGCTIFSMTPAMPCFLWPSTGGCEIKNKA